MCAHITCILKKNIQSLQGAVNIHFFYLAVLINGQVCLFFFSANLRLMLSSLSFSDQNLSEALSSSSSSSTLFLAQHPIVKVFYTIFLKEWSPQKLKMIRKMWMEILYKPFPVHLPKERKRRFKSDGVV